MAAITSQNVAQAIVKLVASQALPPLVANLCLGNIVNRDYEPTLAQAGDVVNVPIPPTLSANNIAEAGSVTTQNPSLGNAQIVLNTHAEATFQIPDVTKVLAVPDLLRIYMEPSVAAIVPKTGSSPVTTHNLAFTKSAIGLVIRRLPQPLPGTGAIAEYAELGNFGMRVVMSYQPNTLAQQFTVDVLYGCGILRNAAGVQVNT